MVKLKHMHEWTGGSVSLAQSRSVDRYNTVDRLLDEVVERD
jgi:hypothetical protein